MDGAEVKFFSTDITLEQDCMDTSYSPSTNASNQPDFEGASIETPPAARDIGAVLGELRSMLQDLFGLQSVPKEHADLPQPLLKKLSKLQSIVDGLSQGEELSLNDGTFTKLIGTLESPSHPLAFDADRSDCDDTIMTYYRRAMNLPPDYPNLADMLGPLGSFFMERFEQTGNPSDVSRAIEAFQKVIGLTPDGHDYLPARLNSLGNLFMRRFERMGDFSDVDEAITAYQIAIELTPVGHANLPAELNNLGNALMRRFQQTGNPSDSSQAIEAQQRAVFLIPDGHAATATLLGNLGNSLIRRFKQTGDLSDMSDAVAAHQTAVELTPDGYESLAPLLHNAGNSLLCRFERLGNLCDVSEAIALQQRAVKLTPEDNVNFPMWLSSLGKSLTYRFEHTGDLSDVSEAIEALQRAAKLTPDDHPELPALLSDLGYSLSCQFQRTGELADIAESVAAHETAISLTPEGHNELPHRLNSLANSFTARFERTGGLSDIAEAVALHERVVDLMPYGHPNLPGELDNQGTSLACRFELTSNLVDIDGSIASYRRAIDLTPVGHPNLPGQFANMGCSLTSRFERTGDLSDLAEAISAHQTAVELTPDGHAHLTGRLCNLGTTFMRQFERTGDLSAAAEAIAAHQRALDLTPDGHAGLPRRLVNLGSSYMIRFHHKGDVSDLAEAVVVYERAVDCTPDGHADLPALLNNFANSLLHLFELTGNPRDISRATGALRRAVDLTPEGHVGYPAHLNGLGSALTRQFALTGDLSVINEAVAVLERALASTPDDHSRLPALLRNLAESFTSRSRRTLDPFDMVEAIAAQEKAVELTPDGHADLSSQLVGLAQMLQQYSTLTQDGDAMDASISNYKSAANCTSGPPSDRLKAAIAWASLSYQHHPDSAETLDAFDTAIQSISLIASLEDTVEGRYTRLHSVSHFPPQAAAAACSLGRPGKALEWLEQSRCLVWTQLNNLRTPLDALRMHDEALAQRLSEVSRQLEAAGSSRRVAAIEMPLSDKISATNEAHAHLKLAKEWDELINTVRSTVPGFDNFLRPTPSPTLLRHIPDSGPIVIINVHKTRCDAIVLRAGQDKPTSLHLPIFSLQKAVEYRDRLSLVLHQRGLRLREAGCSAEDIIDKEMGRGIRQMKWKKENSAVLGILENLWKEIVKPVLAALGFPILDVTSDTPPPRIWWCPTGPLSFLPLHAAGIYRNRNSESIFDYVVSSYTPTVTSITDRVKNNHPIDASVSGLLLTSQPDAPGASSIPGVTKEVTSLYALATEHGVRSLKLEGAAVTVSEFIGHMEGFSSIHLACHASQDASEPLRSRFLFHDGSLDLGTINKKNLKHADLAFLSACQTSTGEEKLTEEAVHLAAGMLAAGYRRVVATMWAIKDEHAPDVASDFYGYLWSHQEEGSGGGFDGSLSAYALHHAIQRLRNRLDNSEQSLLAWIPYVHFGL